MAAGAFAAAAFFAGAALTAAFLAGAFFAGAALTAAFLAGAALAAAFFAGAIFAAAFLAGAAFFVAVFGATGITFLLVSDLFFRFLVCDSTAGHSGLVFLKQMYTLFFSPTQEENEIFQRKNLRANFRLPICPTILYHPRRMKN